jgi:hypothetical protein
MKTLAIIFGIMSLAKSYSQDLLTMRSGATYTVKILEITDRNVRFKMYGNPDGPTYDISRNSFSTIRYQNGTSEQLAVKEDAAPQSVVINGYNTSDDPEPLSYSYNSQVTYTQPASPVRVQTRTSAGDVIGAILFTGMFALKVASQVQPGRCTRTHAYSRGGSRRH